MDNSWLLLDMMKSSAVVGAGLVMTYSLRHRSASMRRWILASSLVGSLALPLASQTGLSYEVSPPAPISQVLHVTSIEPIELIQAADLSYDQDVNRLPANGRSKSPETHWLLWLWGLGLCVVLGRVALGHWRAHLLKKQARPAHSWAIAQSQAAQMTSRSVAVLECDRVCSPAVAGVFSPVVLVPTSARSWDDSRKSQVLLHEIEHIQNRDGLVFVLSEIATALHWYNPLFWLARTKLVTEREKAADDAVLRAGVSASTYATTLASIATKQNFSALGSVMAIAQRSQLSQRVEAIVSVNSSRDRPTHWQRFAVTGVLLTLVLGAACVTSKSENAAIPQMKTPGETGSNSPPPISAGSTIDVHAQQAAKEELDQAMTEWQATRGVVVVLDPSHGDVIANIGRNGNKYSDIATQNAFVTGSTFKAITLAAALEQGVVTLNDRFDCEQGKRSYGSQILEDWHPFGTLSISEMMSVSTNVGFSKVYDKIGGDPMLQWLKRFHLDQAITKGGEGGILPTKLEDRSYEGAEVAIGEKVAVTPLQMAAVYATFANDGIYTEPRFARDKETKTERLLKPETAKSVMTTLQAVVSSEQGTGSHARVAGVQVAGKTGTAVIHDSTGKESTYSSFIGIAPANQPKYVVLVGLENPKNRAPGGKATAPVFSRLVTRLLSR